MWFCAPPSLDLEVPPAVLRTLQAAPRARALHSDHLAEPWPPQPCYGRRPLLQVQRPPADSPVAQGQILRLRSPRPEQPSQHSLPCSHRKIRWPSLPAPQRPLVVQAELPKLFPRLQASAPPKLQLERFSPLPPAPRWPLSTQESPLRLPYLQGLLREWAGRLLQSSRVPLPGRFRVQPRSRSPAVSREKPFLALSLAQQEPQAQSQAFRAFLTPAR